MTPKALRPWGWLADKRLTFALKVVGLVVLPCYAAQFAFGFLAQIRAVVYILIGTVFAYLIYPFVHRLRRRMPLVALLVSIPVAGILWVVALRVFGVASPNEPRP